MIKLKELILEADKFYPPHTRQAINCNDETTLTIISKQMEKLVGKQQVNSFHVTVLVQ